jgi:hypothetical protein
VNKQVTPELFALGRALDFLALGSEGAELGQIELDNRVAAEAFVDVQAETAGQAAPLPGHVLGHIRAAGMVGPGPLSVHIVDAAYVVCDSRTLGLGEIISEDAWQQRQQLLTEAATLISRLANVQQGEQ